MPLTDTAIRKAKPDAKPQKLRDGGGLYLLLRPDGARWWRWDYRRPVTGKRNTLSLGTYPDTGLAEARQKHVEARKLLAAGVDPGEQRRAEKAATADRAANTFAAVAEEMMVQRAGRLSASSRDRALRSLAYLSPIASLPIAAVDGPLLLAALRKIEARGGETTHRARAFAGQVFRYGIATGRNTGNPARDLLGALAPVKGGHFASLTEPEQVAPLLRASAR